MAEELQDLLERIQKDGVEKARTEADEIVSQAKTKAAEIIANAGKEAETALKQAETDGAVFAERGQKALEQAARDVVLSVGEAVNAFLAALTRQQVAQSLSGESLNTIVTDVIKSYTNASTADSKIEVLVNAEQKQAITDILMSQLAEEMKTGIEIKADDSILAGFRVSIKNEQVEHDFTDEAIAQAFSQLLRPHLAEIVKQSMQK